MLSIVNGNYFQWYENCICFVKIKEVRNNYLSFITNHNVFNKTLSVFKINYMNYKNNSKLVTKAFFNLILLNVQHFFVITSLN